MIKVIASDLDGTILRNGAQDLPEEMLRIIPELKKLGIRFIAASGRPYSNMRWLFGPAAPDISYICENGAVAVLDEKELYQDFFPMGLAKEIMEAMDEKEGAELTVSTRDLQYLKPKSGWFEDMMVNELHYVCKSVGDLSEIPLDICIKEAVYHQDGSSLENLPYWKKLFGDRCQVVTSNTKWVDFIPYGVGKGRALRRILKALEISEEECMAFGDEYNDLDMLQSVHYSFAMAHAKSGIRDKANFVSEKVEDTLWKLIEAGGDISRIL